MRGRGEGEGCWSERGGGTVRSGLRRVREVEGECDNEGSFVSFHQHTYDSTNIYHSKMSAPHATPQSSFKILQFSDFYPQDIPKNKCVCLIYLWVTKKMPSWKSPQYFLLPFSELFLTLESMPHIQRHCWWHQILI